MYNFKMKDYNLVVQDIDRHISLIAELLKRWVATQNGEQSGRNIKKDETFWENHWSRIGIVLLAC